MSEPVTHKASFTLERRWRFTPAQVFSAFATPEAKAGWFKGPPGWKTTDNRLEFRVGGTEHAKTVTPMGTSTFDAVYHNIVPGRRIIYSYHMSIDGVPISVSLATFEFFPEETGTLLRLTENCVMLDDFPDVDGSGRKHGTEGLLDRLEEWLAAHG